VIDLHVLQGETETLRSVHDDRISLHSCCTIFCSIHSTVFMDILRVCFLPSHVWEEVFARRAALIRGRSFVRIYIIALGCRLLIVKGFASLALFGGSVSDESVLILSYSNKFGRCKVLSSRGVHSLLSACKHLACILWKQFVKRMLSSLSPGLCPAPHECFTLLLR